MRDGFAFRLNLFWLAFLRASRSLWELLQVIAYGKYKTILSYHATRP
jgi:hypothetical protein